jgi:glycosyltransferase involved in cell wall biosynthesis
MKILFFSYAYPNPCEPGLATFNRTMIAGLSKDHQVRVVSPVPFVDVWKTWMKGRLPNGLNNPAFKAVPNVPVEYCPWYYTPKMFRTHYGTFMQRSVGPVLGRTIQEFQPDIVLSYWTHPDGEVAVKTAHRFGVRAVTMVGGSDVLLNARTGSRRNSILNVLNAADGVITVSDAIKKVLIEDGVAENKLHVIRRGIDRDLFHRGVCSVSRQKLGLPDHQTILVCVGRLVEVKGHTYLIQACKNLADRGLDFRCYVLGDGPLRASLQKQIDQAGLAHRIELRGSQSSTELSEWYRAADLSILPSLSEGIPNVLLESIACGTPFVASNVGGIPEIADPYQDRLVASCDPDALADAIDSQLMKAAKIARKPRRFEPSSMAQSASKLSSILQFVQTGKMAEPITEDHFHETLSDHGMADHQVSMSIFNKTRNRQLNQYVAKEDDDLCGRTGEGFQYFP